MSIVKKKGLLQKPLLLKKPDSIENPKIAQFRLLYQELSQKYGQDPLKFLNTHEVYIPVSIFLKELSGLELLVKFLRENLSYSNKDIALLLNRSEKTISQAYIQGQKKYPFPLTYKKQSLLVPLSVFRERKLSILETLVTYLKQHFDLTYAEIAQLLQRDQRTIWTVFKRGEVKCSA